VTAPDADGLLTRVRVLHAPVWRIFTTLKGTPGALVHCGGCDLGPHAEDYADWPCSTAVIVYTPDELAALGQRPEST
jgi:hypothetical protein